MINIDQRHWKPLFRISSTWTGYRFRTYNGNFRENNYKTNLIIGRNYRNSMWWAVFSYWEVSGNPFYPSDWLPWFNKVCQAEYHWIIPWSCSFSYIFRARLPTFERSWDFLYKSVGNVLHYTGKALWIGATTFIVIILPLALEIEKDQQVGWYNSLRSLPNLSNLWVSLDTIDGGTWEATEIAAATAARNRNANQPRP